MGVSQAIKMSAAGSRAPQACRPTSAYEKKGVRSGPITRSQLNAPLDAHRSWGSRGEVGPQGGGGGGCGDRRGEASSAGECQSRGKNRPSGAVRGGAGQGRGQGQGPNRTAAGKQPQVTSQGRDTTG